MNYRLSEDAGDAEFVSCRLSEVTGINISHSA